MHSHLRQVEESSDRGRCGEQGRAAPSPEGQRAESLEKCKSEALS